MSDEAAYGGVFAFDFYEVLRVTGGDLITTGSLLTVLGRSREDDGTEGYAVTESDGLSTALPGHCLTSTGRRLRREDFYDGTSVQVTPHGHVSQDG